MKDCVALSSLINVTVFNEAVKCTSFCPAIRSDSQCLVNTTDGSTIGIFLSVPWIHTFGTVQEESQL